ncbi:T9SS type A sorting domain-containing protein [candidate division KSB1 bacterium]|nr:T9SS type A sorting domain-containing protein [candidate division KSB1 bacterium]
MHIPRLIFLSLLAWLFGFTTVTAQTTEIKQLDIAGGITNGTIQITVTPTLTKGPLEKVFDGNAFTEIGVQNTKQLSLTLELAQPAKFYKSSIFGWMDGAWSLEAATSRPDLDQKSGSYSQLIQGRQMGAFAWDSLAFNPVEAKILRLSVENSSGDQIFLGEWKLFTHQTFVGLTIWPENPKVLPGTSLTLKANLKDDAGQIYPYTLKDHVSWYSGDTQIVTVDEFGQITGVAQGTTSLTAKTPKLNGATAVSVVADFESPRAATLTKKVALVIQNQLVDPVRKRKIHQVWNWSDPITLVNQLLEEFTNISHGVVQYKIVEKYDDQVCFSRLNGEFMTLDTLIYFFTTPGKLYGRTTPGTLQYIAEIQNRVKFDYLAMIDHYHFAEKRNQGEIDEVWVYAWPFAAMYESQLVGPNAFWYNSPPLEHPALNHLLPVMGWNFERGIAEALESYGHRSESALVKTHGGRWDVHNPNPSYWEIYTRIDKDFPGLAQIGNIHFPPNGLSDYDFTNRRYVQTYADNWKRFPILLDQHRSVNCQEWGSSHVGYMRWWFSHLPHFEGVTQGILNNWWHYIVDYEGAVTLAQQLTRIEPAPAPKTGHSDHYRLHQNYPNPFNASTQIGFSIPQREQISLKVYNLLGAEVRTIFEGVKPAGEYQVAFDGSRLPSGLYFYQLQAGQFAATHKLLLVK